MDARAHTFLLAAQRSFWEASTEGLLDTAPLQLFHSEVLRGKLLSAMEQHQGAHPLLPPHLPAPPTQDAVQRHAR
jgi:hypothetical protein